MFWLLLVTLQLLSPIVDVPTDHAAPWRVPQAGAIKTYGLQWSNDLRAKIMPQLYEIFGR